MELNSILFPAPKFNFDKVSELASDLIFIPKPNETEQYIPCLLLLAVQTTKAPSDKFLIFFHGNAEDIFGASDIGDKLRNRLNMNVVIVEYPRYSIFKQEEDTNKILDNSLIVFDFLVEKFKALPENIFVFGRSIGTSPAIYLSSKRKVGALISVSGFTSIRDAAESLVGGFLKLFVNERFTSVDYIKDVTCPILFIHGQKDALIPFSHSIKLKEACKCPYEIHLPEEMTHNEFDYEEDLLQPVEEFLAKNTGIKQGLHSNIKIPQGIFDMPLVIRQSLKNEEAEKVSGSCLQGSC